jgi:hypothetical protein
MNTLTKDSEGQIRGQAGMSTQERIMLEDKIMERALTLWRKTGKAHLNPLQAFRKTKSEIFSHMKKSSA